MGRNCIVFGCFSNENSENITFHKLGKKRYASWLRAIGRNPSENISPSNTICSSHFHKNDLIMSKQKATIKRNAIPSINLPKIALIYNRSVMSHLSIDAQPSTSTNMIISSDSESDDIKDTTISCSESASLNGSPQMDKKLIKKYESSPFPTQYKTIFHQEELKNKMLQQQKPFKKEKNKLFKKKVVHLKQVVNIIQRKALLSVNACQVLEKSFSGIPSAFMKRMLLNKKKSNVFGKKYDEVLRSFAMTLHFYSHKAYLYVKNNFNLALPSPRTVRGWFSTSNCKPGFSQSALDSLKIKVCENEQKGYKTLCSLMFDGISIKKHTELYNNQTWGYVNVGSTLVEDDKRDYATEAFVLMVVSLSGNWKLPIGYFFINGLDGNERANVVIEALLKLYECGVTVTSLSFDGHKANFTMMTALGVNLYNFDIETATPYFLHPIDKSKIFIMLDACHMINLVRNNWDILTNIVDPDGEIIDFNYVKLLHYIQQTEGLRFGNKLGLAHMDWRKAKMKINLAVQTFSFANDIEFLMVDMKDVRFKEASATIKFIRTFDKLFDLLNSRNPLTVQWKMPLSQKTETLWMPEIKAAIEYMKQLKTLEGSYLIQTTKNTGFVGFILSSLSVIGLYEKYVKSEKLLNYLLTYKLSTDHLELFFCSIRARNGWNNDPSSVQFFHSYRRLLLHHDINGNCIPQDPTNILQTTLNSTTAVPLQYSDVHIVKKYMLENNYRDNVINDHDYCLPINIRLSDSSGNTVSYIAGYAVNMAIKLIKCPTCQDSLSSTTNEIDLKLPFKKKWGNLTVPSVSSRLVCKTVELSLKKVFLITDNELPAEKKFIPTLINTIHSQLISNKNLFLKIQNHNFECLTLEENHISRLIKTLSSCYIKLRLYNVAKKQSYAIKGNTIRKTLTKMILFSHQ